MPDQNDFPSDSDESDADYVPEGAEEVLSEEDSDAAVSENDPNEDNDENKSGKSKKRRKSKSGKGSKRKKKVEKEESDLEDETVEKKQLSEEDEKRRADMLWADFMKDTDTVPKPKETSEIKLPQSSTEKVTVKPEETVKIKEVYEFAGEEVTVEKEVPVAMLPKAECTKRSPLTSENASSARGRGLSGGLSSVLGQLGKKPKISTLEKSKLDWENFKKQQDLQEEISSHNKGKDGYLERQDFLQRADLRQFEIEKQMRSNNRRSNR